MKSCGVVSSLLCLMALAPSPARAASPRWQSWPAGEGTRVLLVEDHRQPIVHLRVLFPAGRTNPFVREAGAERVMELLLRDGEGELRRETDRLGARIWSVTGNESSSLSARFLRQDLDRGLALVQRILGQRVFDRREARRIGRAAALEWRAAMGRPQYRLYREALLTLFPRNDPRLFGWDKPERGSTKSATLAAVLERIVRLPGRVIGLAGDLDRERAERIAATLLPPVRGGQPRAASWGAARPASERPAERDLTLPRLEQVFIALGRESLTRDDPRYPALLLADHALGGHFYSRLYRALRHESGQTYGVRTTAPGGRRTGVYALITFTRVDNAERAERSLRQVLEQLQREGVSEEERRLALSALRGRLLRRSGDPSSLLSRFSRDLIEGGEPGAEERELERASLLSLEQINEVVREFYDPAKFTVWRVGPGR